MVIVLTYKTNKKNPLLTYNIFSRHPQWRRCFQHREESLHLIYLTLLSLLIERRHLEIFLVKCPFTLCLNPEYDEFIIIDEVTTDVRSNSKIWGVSFPWPHHHSCLPAATRTGHFCKKPCAIFTWKHALWMSWTDLYNK